MTFGAPRPQNFIGSLVLHATVLLWVALSPLPKPEPAKNLYEQTIAGNEKKLVWYKLNDKLPEVSALERKSSPRPPKAEVKNPKQNIVAKARKKTTSQQLVWTPAPKIEAKIDFKAPNLLAFEPPKLEPPPPPKNFTPPPEQAKAPEPSQIPTLPDAPPVQTAAVQPTAPPEVERAARPVRQFVPPIEQKHDIAQPQTVNEAPPDVQIAALPSAPNLSRPALPVKPAPRTFIPPKVVASTLNARSVPTNLPVGPMPVSNPPASHTIAGLTAPPAAKPGPLVFVPPPKKTAGQSTKVELPDEPPPIPKDANLTAAVVGLKPIEKLDVSVPEVSKEANFSAGPEKRTDGADGQQVESARVFVPDLTISGGADKSSRDLKPTLLARVSPTSRDNLIAAARLAPPRTSEAPVRTGGPVRALRVNFAPDPRLNGKSIYTVAIQMPNITSYIGSWIMWYAERDPLAGEPKEVRPPFPLRKVDPKYIVSAADERVEGTVQVSAIINKEGKVDTVWLLKHLDNRLDQSAVEALSKWEFEPALRDGEPVAVDAVFEVPFRLAPRAPAK